MRVKAAALCVLVVGVLAASAASAAAEEAVPVLGSKKFAAPFGSGFGAAQPEVVSNGGVPSGTMEGITWHHWGEPVAYGRGLGHQYKPRGGYYPRPVRVRLRAEKLGACPGTGSPAYTRLRVKFQNRPGGGFGDWFLWSGAQSLCKPLFR